jgi:prepilin-type N-terminal cleavage/methylation domain-containing protein
MLRNEKGFTLIEIIAVLIILGILAAVAVPKYIDMTTQAKKAAAAAEVAELKSSLNLAWARLFLTNGTAPTVGGAVITNIGFVSGTATNIGIAPDIWNVTLTAGIPVIVAVNARNADSGYIAAGSWNVPATN